MESRGGWVLITVQVPAFVTPAATAPCFWPALVLHMDSEGTLIPFLCIEPGLAAETLLASLRNSLRVYDPQTFNSQYFRKFSVKKLLNCHNTT